MITSAMNSLRLRFIDRLDTLLPGMQRQLGQIRGGEALEETFGAVLVDVHRIAGLAGSFGFFDLGNRAAETEAALRRGQGGGFSRATVDEAAQHLAGLVEAMERTLDGAQGTEARSQVN